MTLAHLCTMVLGDSDSGGTSVLAPGDRQKGLARVSAEENGNKTNSVSDEVSQVAPAKDKLRKAELGEVFSDRHLSVCNNETVACSQSLATVASDTFIRP